MYFEKVKKLRTSGGGGGGSRPVRTPPDEGGRGGQKRANSCGRPLWMAPKSSVTQLVIGVKTKTLVSSNPQTVG